MIDIFTIVVTTGAIMFVIVRAVALDRKLPWFAPPAAGTDRTRTPHATPPWRRTR